MASGAQVASSPFAHSSRFRVSLDPGPDIHMASVNELVGGLMTRLVAQTSRLLFTAGLVITVAGFAWWSDSHNAALSNAWRNALGFSSLSLVELRWHQTLTSLVLTAGEFQFVQSVLMICIAVGMCEWRFGSCTTAWIFFTSHLIVTVGLALFIMLPWHLAGASWATVLSTERDVGPSAGYYGCLGAVFAHRNSSVRTCLMVAIAAVLIGRLALSVPSMHLHPATVSADLSHLAAFPFGLLIASRWIPVTN